MKVTKYLLVLLALGFYLSACAGPQTIEDPEDGANEKYKD